MFAVFLRAKIDIEGKVNALHQQYFKLLRAPICELEFTEKNDQAKAENILQEKAVELNIILKEYKNTLSTFEEVSTAFGEAQELTSNLEDQIDSLFDALDLKIPLDLKKREEAAVEEVEQCESLLSIKTEEFQEKEESTGSDKENYRHSSDSDQYFSPIVVRCKSFKDSEGGLYTPAVKSNVKPRFIKKEY